MDLDYALRIEQPTSHTDYSASYQRRNYEKWEYSNRVSLLIIRCSSLEAFWGIASKYITKVSEYLAKTKVHFAKNIKAETSMLDLNKV